METDTINPTVLEDCGACGKLFATLDEVFSHPCDAINAMRNHGLHRGAAAINIDPPQGTGQTSNQYGTFANHAPSDKQIAFITRLCAERALELDPAWVRTKSRCSSEIDRLLAIPVVALAAVSAPRATDKQVALVAKLWAERMQPTMDVPDFAVMPKSAVSTLITNLFDCPKLPLATINGTTPSTVINEAGFYELVLDGQVTIYKVQKAVHGSGNLYAKELLLPGPGEIKGSWEYRGIAPLRQPLIRLTLERAKELGHLYGVCMKCGATLTDERSIEAGIGPVCGSRGW